jgi:YVTN family beta-propeller protein
MLHSCVQRQFSGRRLTGLVTGRSVVAALGLLLLLPVFFGVVGLDSGYQAQAAPAFHAGGPDQFGYTFKDSNEPGGPVYAWDDISASGVIVTGWTSYDDGYAGPIPIGFSFNYYGTDYTDLYIGTNGFVSFGRGYGTIPGGTLPQTSNPNNDIALFGSDLYLYNYGGVSKIYYQTLHNPTRFVVQFVDLHYCCGQNTPHTFQVILYPNGDILAQYRMLNGTSTSYVGIENATGTDGLSYGAALADNLAIRYTYPVGVYLNPASQTQYGPPGGVITHRIRLINRTGGPDSFDLALEPGYAWPTTLSITRTGVLTGGASVDFFAQVAIPPAAAPGDSDQAVITVTSVASPSIASTASLATQVVSGELGYVTLTNSRQVTVMDVPLHAVLGTIDVYAAGCSYPTRASMPPTGHLVVVSCEYSDNVVLIDTSSNRVLTTINGIPGPAGIAFTRNDEFALVGSRYNALLTVFHTKDYTTSTIATPGSTRSVAAHPYLNRAYATSSNGALLVIDTTNFTVGTTIPVFSDPWDVVVSPDGRWVFVSDRSGAGLAKIDALDNTVHARLTGTGALTGLAVTPDGSTLYVASRWDTVKVIDIATFQVTATVPNTNSTWQLAATCDGGEIWVGNDSSTVPIIDTDTNLVAQSVAMPGGGAHGIVLCPQFVAEGVFLLPPSQGGAGALGQAVTRQLMVVNALATTESFTLALEPTAWPAALSTTTVGPLNPGQTATFDIVVTIPPDVAWYARDTVLVTATSTGDPSLSAGASVTIVADSPPVIGVSPAALGSRQLANQTVDQTLAISNGNGITLTVALSDVDLTPERAHAAPLDQPAAWLHQDPASAAVTTNSSQAIVVTFDANGLQPRTYQGAIIVQSNDPVRPSLSVPVTMTVEPTADMGRVSGAISDAWTQHPLTATVQLQGVFTMTARPSYEIWATAGAYTLTVGAPGYAPVAVPVVISAGDVTLQDVAIEPYLPRLEWGPQAVAAGAPAGQRVQQTLVISNTGPAPLEITLFEIDLDFNRRAPQPAELAGKRILFDRGHGQPASSQYSRLIGDAVAAGAVVVENWYFPIEASVLEGYDILWINCCGNLSWGYSELHAVSNWLQRGGAVLVQGESNMVTAGPASIFDIHYTPEACTSGATSAVALHPVSAGVSWVHIASTCSRLAPSAAADIVVNDQAGRPHIVARQHRNGKMVVISARDLQDSNFFYEDNRLLGNNILAWLARPAYSDVPWLSLSPITSTLPGHSSLPVTVGFDATALAEGAYQAALAIEHNDGAQTFPVELPVTLTVLPPQDRVKYLPLILVHEVTPAKTSR